ncbi:hypothetical protein MMC27_003964 [Xylographa pallens]|nr:hypothetical protein [Xylographa pallens]
MAANVTPWQQRPVFVAATNTTPAFGDPLQYDVPRQFPVTDPDDRTSYHPGQRTWSVKDPPDILYLIYPDQDWYRFMHSGLPGPKIDHYGRVVLESWPPDPMNPRPLLDFPILPDQIGTKEHYIFFEIWRRLDPRVRLVDITMRMNDQRITDNALNSALQRIRLSYTVLSWHQMWRNIEQNKNRDKVLASLPICAIEANSSRGHTPGLIIPWMGEDGGRIAQPYIKPHTRSRVSHHTVRDQMQRIEPARAQFRYAASRPGLEQNQNVARTYERNAMQRIEPAGVQSQYTVSRPSFEYTEYVPHMYVRDELQRIEPAGAQPQHWASIPSFQSSQHVPHMYKRDEMQHFEPARAHPAYTASGPNLQTTQDVADMYELDEMQQFEPARAPQPQYTASGPSLHMDNFNPQHENLFNWDQDGNNTSEDVDYGNFHTIAGFDSDTLAAVPNFEMRMSDNYVQGHGSEHLYDVGDYRDVELDNNHNEDEEMYFESGRATENNEELHIAGSTEGGSAWTSHEGPEDHEGHSPAFCSLHCFQIPLDSLPTPFSSFLEREAP